MINILNLNNGLTIDLMSGLIYNNYIIYLKMLSKILISTITLAQSDAANVSEF